MAPPSALSVESNGTSNDTTSQKGISQSNGETKQAVTNNKEPLKLNGVLNQFKYFDVTPVIGREFQDVDLADWLKAPNSDELIRDLAITGSFFIRKTRSRPTVLLTALRV